MRFSKSRAGRSMSGALAAGHEPGIGSRRRSPATLVTQLARGKKTIHFDQDRACA